MRILGIDPALVITGYGVIDVQKGAYTVVRAGIIRTSSRQGLPQRLAAIHESLKAIIQECAPHVMVIEKLYVHHHHQTTAFLLGHARGIACLTCAEAKIPCVEYAATRVKKALTGKGLASKSQVQKMVARTLNLTNLPRYADVTDALALAITYCQMNSAQQAVLIEAVSK